MTIEPHDLDSLRRELLSEIGRVEAEVKRVDELRMKEEANTEHRWQDHRDNTKMALDSVKDERRAEREEIVSYRESHNGLLGQMDTRREESDRELQRLALTLVSREAYDATVKRLEDAIDSVAKGNKERVDVGKGIKLTTTTALTIGFFCLALLAGILGLLAYLAEH